MSDTPRQETSPLNGYFPSLTAALVVGLVNLVLLSAVLIGLVVDGLSSLRGMIASVQDAGRSRTASVVADAPSRAPPRARGDGARGGRRAGGRRRVPRAGSTLAGPPDRSA